MRCESILDYPDGPNQDRWVLKSGRGKQKVGQRCEMSKIWPMVVSFEEERKRPWVEGGGQPWDACWEPAGKQKPHSTTENQQETDSPLEH